MIRLFLYLFFQGGILALVSRCLLYWASLALLLFTFYGCTTRTVIQTEYVATPTYCKVKLPQKPDYAVPSGFVNIVDYHTFVDNLRKILVYADELEMALLCCTNSDDCLTKP